MKRFVKWLLVGVATEPSARVVTIAVAFVVQRDAKSAISGTDRTLETLPVAVGLVVKFAVAARLKRDHIDLLSLL